MLTYQVRVECQYQASTGMKYSFNPNLETMDKHDTYGNRFISGEFHPFIPFITVISFPTLWGFQFFLLLSNRSRERKGFVTISKF